MIDRRDVLKAGLAGPLALGFSGALHAAAGGVALWVSDSRYGAQPPVAAPGTPLRMISGDVTALWVDCLDGAWRKPGLVIAGHTGSDALFVIEQLAQGRGRRVVWRRELAPAAGGLPALVQWTIAPVHPSMKA